MELKDIQELSELRSRIEKLESTMFAPKLTNFSHLSIIYDWINEYSRDLPDYTVKGTPDANRRAIFIFLYLYSPRSFTDTGFMVRGLRSEIARLLNLSNSHISNLAKDLAFHYKIYSSFRNNVDTLLEKIQYKIDEHSLSL